MASTSTSTSTALYPHGTLTANLTAFCGALRRDHGFSIGPGETADALRALEWVGVADLEQVRLALRLVLCAAREEIAPFDQAFDAFFLPGLPRGARQHNLHSRHTRPRQQPAPAVSRRTTGASPDQNGSNDDAAHPPGRAARQFLADEDEDAGGRHAARLMRARYSDAAGEAAAPTVPRDGLDTMLEAAGILVRRLRLGTARRWRAMPAGSRFDFRRTMRGSLQTGGEALRPRWQGHPRRNPRIVVVVDGSRSMSDYAPAMLQFAYALSQRTRRLDAFVFSTELHDVTHQLRYLRRGSALQLTSLMEAWGGGTRIGQCLERLLREFGHRCLSEHTLIFVLSDGLDVGEPDRLRHALRELRRRSAGLIWINPLLGTPGYSPTARGMRAALAYIDVFTAAGDAQAFKTLAERLTL